MQFEQLSFWEKENYLQALDFVIAGAGIVGTTAAIFIKERYPDARILVIDKGVLPHSASTKNAGFACFGSPSELIDDLKHQPEQVVWDTVALRWEGLQELRKIVPDQHMNLEIHGSYDLLLPNTEIGKDDIANHLEYLNNNLKLITGESAVFSCVDDNNNLGFSGIKGLFYNRLEGQLNPSLMMEYLRVKARNKGVQFLTGVTIDSFRSELYGVQLMTPHGVLRCANFIIATNGFSRDLIPGYAVAPARAQVLVTSAIDKLPWKGTFHADRGYYYFRNIGKRILLGGGRNLDIKGETTSDLELNTSIHEHLEELLRTVILPGTDVNIEYRWSGIMGIGEDKKPIVEKLNDRIAIGVRMGGMGVAIGTKVGQKLAELF